MDSTQLRGSGNEQLDEQHPTAQTELLSVMLCRDINIEAVTGHVEPWMLRQDGSAKLYRTIRMLHDTGATVNPDAVRSELASDRDYEWLDARLLEIEATPASPELADQYVTRFVELSWMRRWRQGAAQLWHGLSIAPNFERAQRIVGEFSVPTLAGDRLSPLGIGELGKQNPTLREPVIHGILRRGEIANIIAAPKVGKSWLAYGIALSVVTGRAWLGKFAAETGRVLLVDNELHRELIPHRVNTVAKSLCIPPGEYERRLDVLPLRGSLTDYHGLGRLIDNIESGYYSLMIFDAHYRMLPSGVSENDNGAIAGIYNLLDSYAANTDSAIALIHHMSRENQSQKSVTDLGSGAGSQSRAADTHLVLREHSQDEHFVLDARLRSFEQVEPITLKWEFPIWTPTDLDPSRLKQPLRNGRQQENDRAGEDSILSALREADGNKLTQRRLRTAAGMGPDRLNRLTAQLKTKGLLSIETVTIDHNKSMEYRLTGGGL